MAKSKKSSARPTAKLASTKAARNNYGAAQSGRVQAENVVKLGSAAMQDFLSTSAGSAQKAQEKVFSLGRENAESVAKSADAVSQMMNDAVSMSREGIESCIECGNMTNSFAKDITSETFELANKAFSDNVELSKELFACRTINDVFELQNRAVRQSIDNFFSQSVKLSDMMFEYTSEALEPLNERVAEATNRFSKALAA